LLVESFSARVKLAFSATATNVAMSWTGNSLTGNGHLASNNSACLRNHLLKRINSSVRGAGGELSNRFYRRILI
jgi:hypothetical protein